MSDDDKDLPPDTPEDAEFPAEDSSDDSAEDQLLLEGSAKKKSGKAKLIAWLVGLIAVAALSWFAYTAFVDWRSARQSTSPDYAASIDELQRRVDQSDTALAALQAQIEARPDRDFGSDIDELRRGIDAQQKLLASVPARMSSIENSVASLAGISAGARQTFLLAEAEYYLQIANAQLQLANNPQLASLALRMADERVTQLSDPALTDVRRAVSDELAAIEIMEKPDLGGATLTLASLARVVETLPLDSADPEEQVAPGEGGDEQSGVDRAWASVRNAVSGLVKYTPPEKDKPALLTSHAEYLLRNNIAMQLQAARLALLRGEQTIFEQSLDDVTVLLDAYFDVDDAQVQSVKQTIAEVREKVVTSAAPDISRSLRLLRQYKTLNETGE